VAVRHAVQKPIVHLITAGEEIPFDVANMRAVPYALDDPDALEAAQEELARKVESIEEADWVAARNPISAAREVSLLQGSEQPEARATGDLLASVGDLRDEVRALARRLPASEPERFPLKERVVRFLLDHDSPASPGEIAEAVQATQPSVRNTLLRLEKEGKIERLGSGFWQAMIPF
jgi:DNA-binding transcriptional ArsR family regulator